MGSDEDTGGIHPRRAARPPIAANVILAFFQESYVDAPNNSTFFVKELPILVKLEAGGLGNILV